MSRYPALILALLIAAVLLLSGCTVTDGNSVRTPSDNVPSSSGDIAEELKQVRARERVLEGALHDAKITEAQTYLWLGAGACFLGAIALVAIGIWTSRRILLELGLLAAGVGGLCIFAAWLTPYALWIGISIAVITLGIAGFMLWNRNKALLQVSSAVEKIKTKVPEYKEIFRGEIDTMQENLVHHIRPKKLEKKSNTSAREHA